jgi:Protein of unknown function (DUF3251).
MKKSWFFVFIISLLLVGCDFKKDLIADVLTQLKPTLDQLTRQAAQHDEALNLLRKDVDAIHDLKKNEGAATLVIGSKANSILTTDVGNIIFKIKDVSAVKGGSKVGLVIGNPLAAKLQNLKFKAEYGSLDESGSVLEGSQKFKDVSLTKALKAGAWTRVAITLDQPHSELGYIRLSEPEIGKIKLRGKS